MTDKIKNMIRDLQKCKNSIIKKLKGIEDKEVSEFVFNMIITLNQLINAGKDLLQSKRFLSDTIVDNTISNNNKIINNINKYVETI